MGALIIGLLIIGIALYFSEYLQFEISSGLASMIVSLVVSLVVIYAVL